MRKAESIGRQLAEAILALLELLYQRQTRRRVLGALIMRLEAGLAEEVAKAGGE